MAKIKNYVTKQNLAQYRTYIEDTNPDSTYFKLSQITDILTGGKNAFLIEGSELLKKTTEVLVEIIDSDGNPVYLKPIRNYIEGLSRVVSIEIYEDTPRGFATMTILGEATHDENGNPVPDEWRGKYNVKYTKRFTIEPVRINTTYIRLYNRPQMTVREVVLPYKEFAPINNFLVTEASGSTLSGKASEVSKFTTSTGTTSQGWTLWRYEEDVSTAVSSHIVKVIGGTQRFKKEMVGGQYSASVAFTSSLITTPDVIETLANDTFTTGSGHSIRSESGYIPTSGIAGWETNFFFPNTILVSSHSNAVAYIAAATNGGKEATLSTNNIANDNFTYYADMKWGGGGGWGTGGGNMGLFFRASGTVQTSSPNSGDMRHWVWRLDLTPTTDFYSASSITIQQVSGSLTGGTTLQNFNLNTPVQIFPNGLAHSHSLGGIRLGINVDDRNLTAWYEPYGGGTRTIIGTVVDPTSGSNYWNNSEYQKVGFSRINGVGVLSGSWDNITVTRTTAGTSVSQDVVGVFSSSIVAVYDDTTIRLAAPFRYVIPIIRTFFGIPFESTNVGTITNYTTTDYEIRYYSSSTGLVTLASRSLAEVKLYNLTTFSGDVARAKYYVRELQGLGEFKQVGDILLDENELTLTQSLDTGESDVKQGYFQNQAFADNYWFGGLITSASYSGSY